MKANNVDEFERRKMERQPFLSINKYDNSGQRIRKDEERAEEKTTEEDKEGMFLHNSDEQ